MTHYLLPSTHYLPLSTHCHWVVQAVQAVEDQAWHTNLYQRSQHTQGVVAPDLLATDEHVFCGQLGM